MSAFDISAIADYIGSQAAGEEPQSTPEETVEGAEAEAAPSTEVPEVEQPDATPSVEGEASGEPAPADSTGSAGDYQFPIDTERFTAAISERVDEQVSKQIQEEYGAYLQALQVSPSALVGRTVPGLDSDEDITLASREEADRWQQGVRQELGYIVDGMTKEAQQKMQEQYQPLQHVVDLFRNNPDLVPGAPGFNKNLADLVAEHAKDYAVTNEEGKITGYKVPLQPLVNALRKVFAQPTTVASKPKQEKTAPAEKPQVGLRSQAGQSSGKENFDMDLITKVALGGKILF